MIFEGLTVAAKSPLHYAYPREGAAIRKDGGAEAEAEAEDTDGESTAHEYHWMVHKVAEVRGYVSDAVEGRSLVAAGEEEDGGILGLGKCHWT